MPTAVDKWTFTLADARPSRNVKLDPPGFAEVQDASRPSKKTQSAEDQSARDTELANLKMKKAWETAIAVGKSIPMNAFMLYMSGNSIQIFSVMVTVMMLINAIKAILNTNTVFERFSSRPPGTAPTGISALLSLPSDPLVYPKLVYVLMQCGCLALGVWKCGAMGLLPTTTSDWLAFMEPKKALEHAFGGVTWSAI
ncbi:uncharacterized protein EV422DRAFT_566132 [Fimicolochytrium jonesii]|uniref:uncharacterized protein n=1 Tax=Fimicolochytrium jonesii TaxID=1396493 RepID=UPI0022FE9863|nr:uncharacterized protein EV422DRAFT_566132 [Fimicolochytrium jonesii]KAI8822440.1 hypothetical protein EV422DRAFT_566132 [Fimicolochytrium jonesii]